MIVDNRPGAGGTIGTDMVAKAPPDGYTLVMGTAAHAVSAAVYKELPFNPRKNFAPITQLVATPLLFVASP